MLKQRNILMKNSEMVLSGMDQEIDEMDDEDQYSKNEISNAYDIQSVVNSINTKSFKIIWNMCIDKIKKLEIEDQRNFCYKLVSKIKDIYNIDIIDKNPIYEMVDFKYLYDTVYFIECNVIDFLANFFKILKIDIMTHDLTGIFSDNFNLIEGYINYIKKNSYYIQNKILSKIILTYNKNDMAKLFEKKYVENKMDILLKIQNLE
jgi:hypothetical protein